LTGRRDRTCALFISGESNEHADLEKIVKTFETHHNALDLTGKFIDLTR